MEPDDYKKETESAFTGACVRCLLAGIFLGILLDGGLISEPAIYFYSPMAGYLFVRYVGWRITRKIPRLTKVQRYGVSLVPLYGFVVSYIISSIVCQMRFD